MGFPVRARVQVSGNRTVRYGECMKFSFLIANVTFGVALGGMTLYGAQAQVAILDSSINTKAFFAAHYRGCDPPSSFFLGADEYQRYFLGWTYVLSNPGNGAPIPFDIIHDADVTEQALSNYKLLILSNTASLSDDQQKNIRQWVTHG